jgi:hypothetical protein
MKGILLLASTLMFLTTSFAQWRNNGPTINNGQNNQYNNSALVLTTDGNNSFAVAIDNGYQYQSNGNRVNIPDIAAGSHTVLVYEYRRNIFGTPRPKLIYSSNVYFKQGVEHYIYINQFGQASFEERNLYGNSGNNGNNGQYGGNGNNGYGYNCGKQKGKGHKKHAHGKHQGNKHRDDD